MIRLTIFSKLNVPFSRLWRKLHDKSTMLWLVILLGFALRVYHLDYRPLWDDEAFSVLIVSSDIWNVALAAVKDTFPPLHHYVLAVLMLAVGWSEFSVRFASLLAGVLAIPLTYQVGRLCVDRRAGLWAALVMALSPFMVYFSQETRAYSWLVLTTLLSVYTFVRVVLSLTEQGHAGVRQWAWFSVASAAMLYTHFLSLWILVVEGLYFLWFWSKHRRGFRAWIGAHIGIGILFLPWVLLILGVGVEGSTANAGIQQFAGIQTDAPIASLLWIWQEGQSVRGNISLPDTLRQAVVSFTVGDFLTGTWELIGVLAFAGIALSGLIGLAMWHKQVRRREAQEKTTAFPYPVFFLVLYALLPVLLCYVVAFPASRPHWAKYFIMALPAYSLMVGTGLAILQRWRRGVAALAAGVVIWSSLLSLYNYFENPAYARPDIRPGVRYMEAFSAPDDALLANPPESSPPLWYYFHGHQPFYTPDQVNEERLQAIARTHTGLWVVQNLPVGFDPGEHIERWLTYHTYRTFTDWVGQLVFRYYSMPATDATALQRTLQPAMLFGDRIALREYRVGVQTEGRAQVVQLELAWRAQADMDENYMVGARVVDESGQVWGQTNSSPLGNFRPTIDWEQGETVLDHLGVLLWPGTPPGRYIVQVWMYREEDGIPLPIAAPGAETHDGRLDLGVIQVDAPRYPPSTGMLNLTEEVNRTFDALTLIGYQVPEVTVKPGDDVNLSLFWEATATTLPTFEASLWAEDTTGRQWGRREITVGDKYSTSHWALGQVIRDQYALPVPQDLPDGVYPLNMRISAANRSAEWRFTLLNLTVKGRAKQFAVPRIAHPQQANLGNLVELLGYDLPRTQVGAGDTVRLTLYWRALARMDTSYTVFNHLLAADGQTAGQWDGIPVGGTLPTTEWIRGEVIEDAYDIPVRTDATPGMYRLQVGMYDATTGGRIAVAQESSGAVIDSIGLDTQIEIR